MRIRHVRIAVAIDRDGKWKASGWGDDDGFAVRDAMDLVVDGVSDGEARYWVTAELQIPEQLEIPGKVERIK